MLFRIKRFSVTIWTLLALCLPLVACNPWPSERLKISLSEWPGYEFINLAVAKSFISNAEMVSLTDQSEVVRAYLRGELDVVQLTTVDVLDINLLSGLGGYCLHPSGANEFRFIVGGHSSSGTAECKRFHGDKSLIGCANDRMVAVLVIVIVVCYSINAQYENYEIY